MFPNAVKSYGDVSEDAIFFDGSLMAGGYFLMFCYTSLVLGQKLSCSHIRLLLSLLGIVGILMGLAIALGRNFILWD